MSLLKYRLGRGVRFAAVVPSSVAVAAVVPSSAVAEDVAVVPIPHCLGYAGA